MLTNDTKSFVTLDTYTTRLYFHIAVQFRKLQFPQRAFAYFLRDRTNIHVFSVPYRFTRALWYRYPCTDRLEISRNTVSRERFIIALQSRMQEREAVSVSGKWSMPPRQASTLSSFIRLRPFLEPIPYSPGNIFTKRGGSQLADSKQRFDGTERSIDASENWSADFRRLKGWLGNNWGIVRSLEWRRRKIHPFCCFVVPHACTFVISAFPLLERLTSSKTFGIRYYFVYFVQIFENCRVGWKSSDLFKWTRCVFFLDYGNREWKGKRRNASCKSRN